MSDDHELCDLCGRVVELGETYTCEVCCSQFCTFCGDAHANCCGKCDPEKPYASAGDA